MSQTEKKPFSYVYASDAGCVRTLNEDSVFCGDEFWVVADGMGGHACGEVASKMAVETIVDEFKRTCDLSESIQTAHQAILTAAQKNSNQSGMGTTVVVLSCFDDQYEVAWVGDSRAYLWSDDSKQLAQLSEDHSLVMRLLKSGLLSAEEAKKHPQKHMITQCLGSQEVSRVEVDTNSDSWQPNQQILLCSDGLTDEIDESIISQILSRTTSEQEKVQELVEAAKHAGGKDNISVVLINSPLSPEKGVFHIFNRLIEQLKRFFK